MHGIGGALRQPLLISATRPHTKKKTEQYVQKEGPGGLPFIGEFNENAAVFCFYRCCFLDSLTKKLLEYGTIFVYFCRFYFLYIFSFYCGVQRCAQLE